MQKAMCGQKLDCFCLHINNNKTRLLLMVIAFLALGGAMVFFHASTSYSIERAWFDSEYLYVLHQKEYTVGRWAPISNPHGGEIIKEKKTAFISRVPRATLNNDTVLNLEKSEREPWRLPNYWCENYRDKDFNISENEATTKLFGETMKVTSNKCVSSFWSRSAPIRIRDSLFYCGKFFDRSGKAGNEVPESVVHAIKEGFRAEVNPNVLSDPWPIFAIGDGQLVIRYSNDLRLGSELKMAVWPVGSIDRLTWSTLSLPATKDGYEIQNGFRAYSPNKIILKPKSREEGAWILMCDKNQCSRVDLPSGSYYYDYLLVDDDAKVITVLEVEHDKKNADTPEVSARIVGYW